VQHPINIFYNKSPNNKASPSRKPTPTHTPIQLSNTNRTRKVDFIDLNSRRVHQPKQNKSRLMTELSELINERSSTQIQMNYDNGK